MKTAHIILTAVNKVGSAQTGFRLIARRAVSFVSKVLLCLVPVAALMNSSPATAAQTIVSLTFDDGLNQSLVLNMLNAHGMKATFYINSNMIGTGGNYLSKTELDALHNAGNEIGGHTINHVDLATLTDAQQLAAICDDMATLNTWYPGQIHSFAYPYASTGPTTQSIVAGGCPAGTYTNARTVGGLVSGTACPACPTAESIPPANPYFISTPESILNTTTLDELKTFVTQAENNGGGWVPLVFHNVCDGCDPYSITQANLDAFLTWLKARETNNTYVRTVNQVMTGDLPPPPPPPPLGLNQLINPSLELDANADNYPDCWLRNSNGINTTSWTRTNDAHSGSFGEQIQVTAYTSGDLKLIQTIDVNQAHGGCAPTVEIGASYMLGAWYKSTTSVIPVLFYQDSVGAWQYWKDGPTQPAAANWTQMSFETGTVPAGAQALSFGIAITAVGTLTTDDYAMQKVLPSDTTAPVVSLTAPAAGTVSGTVNVTAAATDNVSVAGVQFKLDGVNLGTEDTLSPYTVAWDTVTASNGSHNLTAVARDAAGNVTTSTAVAVTVNNADTTAPTVSITAPAAGNVLGTVTVSATATDNVGVVGVQFKLDGANLGTEDTTSPYSVAWDTLTAINGAHNLTAVARDAAGNVTTSAVVAVTVNNPDITAPTVSITAPAAGNVLGTVTVTATATDNVGVVGVQFQLDGANLGTEDTTAPYSVAWNSLATVNGNHTLTAVARDAAGNATTSAGVTVTVNNPDTTAPTVSITAPAAGTVSGTVAVSANASDNIGVIGVQFQLDGVNLGAEDTTSPYSVSWDTLTAANGTYTLTAVARDAAGNAATSPLISVTVSNADTTAPTVSLTSPTTGTVSGTVTVSADATDNIGVAGVQFQVDGSNLGSEVTTSPYTMAWNTMSATNGIHTITAVARDGSGNVTTSTAGTVTVSNTTATQPTTTASSGGGGGGSISLIELAMMLMVASVAVVGNKSAKEKTDEDEG